MGRGGIFAQFGDLHGSESLDPRDVVSDQGADFRPARLPKHDQVNFHRAFAVGGSVQSVLLALVEEGLAADAENLGALADLVTRGLERRVDRFALHLFERAEGAS